MGAKLETLDLGGVFPPIPTPFDEDENLALDHLGANLEKWATVPLSGYVVGGSNGEFVSLSIEERLETLRYVCERVPPARLIIAGSGLHSTRETLKQTETMAQIGAHAALVVTPSYYKTRMEPNALIQHYHELAEHSPLPIILYNVPANTGIDMSADTIVSVSDHPNIIGLKDSSGNVSKLGEIILRAKESFQVLAGSASFVLGALAVGAVGTVSALANLAGDDILTLIKAYQERELELAGKIQRRLIRPNAAVTARYGVPGLKFALSLKGYYGGPARRPLLPLSAEQQAEIRGVFKEADLI